MPLMLVATPAGVATSMRGIGEGELVGGTLQAWVEGEDPIVWMLDTRCTTCLMLRRMPSQMRSLSKADSEWAAANVQSAVVSQ